MTLRIARYLTDFNMWSDPTDCGKKLKKISIVSIHFADTYAKHFPSRMISYISEKVKITLDANKTYEHLKAFSQPKIPE